MATIFTEPLNDKINYTQWAQILQKTTFEAGGFIALGLTNMTGTAAPQVAQGSRVEIGGSLYICTANETISGSPSTNATNYVYAVPSGSAASFTYSATVPTWDAVRGGWYNGSNRAVARFYYSGGQYLSKTILDSYGAFTAIDTNTPIPTTGGTAVVTITSVKRRSVYTLPAGGYRYSLSSGGAGNGSGQTGGVASTRDTKTGTFYWRGGEIQVNTGGDGFNGGNGGNSAGGYSTNGGGGGSGAGEESEIVGIAKTKRLPGGDSSTGTKEGANGEAGGHGNNGGRGGTSLGYGYGAGGNGGDGSASYESPIIAAGGEAAYGANGTNGNDGSNTGLAGGGGGGGGGGGAPGWQRPEGGPGGSCTIWRVI